VTSLWLYISPVAYSVSSVPQGLRWAYRLNPLAPVLEGFRWCLLNTNPPNFMSVLYSAAVSITFLVVGAHVFKRMERKFADVI